MIDKNFLTKQKDLLLDEFMFFSVNGGAVNSSYYNKIKVAKINSKNFQLFGGLENSSGLYGPCVSKELRILYWYKNMFTINNPLNQNLFYTNNGWIIKQTI